MSEGETRRLRFWRADGERSAAGAARREASPAWTEEPGPSARAFGIFNVKEAASTGSRPATV